MVSKIWHFTWYLILWHFTWYLKYDMSHGIQNMINMTLEQISHFNLYPQALLTTRTQVEVKVKVSIAASLPGKNEFLTIAAFINTVAWSTFIAYPNTFVPQFCTAYLFAQYFHLSILLPVILLLLILTSLPQFLCTACSCTNRTSSDVLLYRSPLCTFCLYPAACCLYQYCCLVFFCCL